MMPIRGLPGMGTTCVIQRASQRAKLMRIPSTDNIMASGLFAPREQAGHMNEPGPDQINAPNFPLLNGGRPHMNHRKRRTSRHGTPAPTAVITAVSYLESRFVEEPLRLQSDTGFSHRLGW
jgi:hypothetical protein